MSTPSGRLSHSVALSDDLVRNSRERAAAEPAAAQSTNDPPPSSLQLVLDWKRTKEAASVARRAALAAQAQPSEYTASMGDGPAAERQETSVEEQQVLSAVQQAVEAARKAINESPLRVDELPRASQPAAGARAKRHGVTDQAPTVIDRISGEQLLDPSQSASLQPQSADDRRARKASSESRAKIVGEIDLENLEASLRRLNRRQAAAMRLPPAAKLPLTSRRVPPDLPADACIGERTVSSFHGSLRSLEPTRLMPPPMGSSRHPNTLLGVSIGCTVIAGILYYFLETGRSSSARATSQSQVTYMIPRPTSAMESSSWVRPEPLPSTANTDRQTLTQAERSPRPTVTAAVTIPPQQEAMPMGSPIPVAPATAPGGAASGKAARKLDAESIALLVNEAEKHISTGDVVTARMIFQRAAEAGDATAALELAATYDPTVLAKLGVMGMGADVEKARAWYRTAESFGSAEAKQRLRSLDRQ